MGISQTDSNSKGFTVKTYGSLEAWLSFVLPHPKYGLIPGKHFLRSDLNLTSLELSLNALPPGKGMPFLHGHRQNEELYLFLTGTGQMLLDDQVVEVSAGTAVRVAPPVLRSWRNIGDQPLTCVCIQAKADSLVQATLDDSFVGQTPPAWPAG